MNARGVATAVGVTVVLAAVGVAGGYAYAELTGATPAGEGRPAPAAAADPSFPSSPVQDLVPDSDLPPLPTTLPMVEATLGRPGNGIALHVPKGWERVDSDSTYGETRWKGPDDAYSVRVSLLNVHQGTQQMVAAKLAQLPFDSRISDLHVKDQGVDFAEFDYVIDKRRIEQVVRWVTFNGGPARVEIASSGRLVDEPGMLVLTQQIADSAGPLTRAKPLAAG